MNEITIDRVRRESGGLRFNIAPDVRGDVRVIRYMPRYPEWLGKRDHNFVVGNGSWMYKRKPVKPRRDYNQIVVLSGNYLSYEVACLISNGLNVLEKLFGDRLYSDPFRFIKSRRSSDVPEMAGDADDAEPW